LHSLDFQNVYLTMLGDCRLTINGNLVDGVPANFYRIAAYLILSPRGGILPRHRMSSMLWSDTDDNRAAANMRQTLVRIRHLQEENGFRFIEANFSTLYLSQSHDVRSDLGDFVEYLAGHRPMTPVELCTLYGGDLLMGLGEAGESYEDWLSAQRDQLHIEAIDRIAAAVGPNGALSAADRATCARRLLDMDPYCEEALQVLMLEAASHRQVPRLTQLFETMKVVLAEDLGVQPSPQTQTLYVRLLQSLTVT
jgi:DNA-binding SARP family transcriptional activator